MGGGKERFAQCFFFFLIQLYTVYKRYALDSDVIDRSLKVQKKFRCPKKAIMSVVILAKKT